MAEITTSTIREISPALGMKALLVCSPATADTGDTIPITLASYGMTTVWFVMGCQHSTANSIITTEAPTTAVSAGVLTITTGGSANTDKIRTYLVIGTG